MITHARLAELVVRFQNLQVTIADRVLFSIDELLLRPRDRVALLGDNGVGKSTFVRRLVAAATGELRAGIRLSPQTRLGYYDQELEEVQGSATMLDFARKQVSVPEQVVRIQLVAAGFPHRVHGKRIDDLSGGERARLLFVVLSLAQPNFLVLDEPTNHIDIDGKSELETELMAGGATLLLISHDRRFIETVAERFLWIRDRRLVEIHEPQAFFDAGREVGETIQPASTPWSNQPQHDVLERIVELEALLKADRARKSKFQKPQRQAAWVAEIKRLYSADRDSS